MNYLLNLEAKYERFRIKNFTSAEFLLSFYFGICIVLFLLGPVYIYTR